MKKILFASAVLAFVFAACGSKQSTEVEAIDSTVVVEDTIAVDSLAVDTTAVDTIVLK